jgi:TonB-linked SusC/RagA family outer membrane protein
MIKKPKKSRNRFLKKACEISGIFLMLLCCVMPVYAQQTKTVTGTVVDDKSEAVIGASIVIKGTPTTAISDMSGRFSIQAGPDATLVVSFLGYRPQEILVGNQTILNVVLKENARQLEEVVVVGYGTQKKVNLTGSVAVVSGEEILKSPAVSLSNALQGIMPGVTIQQTSGEPGADGGTIRVRGIGSINAGSNPLVLVDGIEMSMDLVDPNSIKSISVLKDAASASIYGIRGANGVVLVTTKRGEEGKVKVNYKGRMSVQNPTNLPEPVSTVQFMELTNQAYTNLGTNAPYDPDLIEEYRRFKPDNWTRFETDWKGDILKNFAALTDHSVTLSGGSSHFTFVGVANYVYQDGLINNNHYSRFNLRLNLDAKITNWLKFSLDGNLVEGERTTPSVSTPKAIINKSLYMPGILAGINADGTWGAGKNADNPIAAAEVGGLFTRKSPDLTLNASVVITPVKNLDVLAQYGRRTTSNHDRSFIRKWEYYERGVYLGDAPLTTEGLTERFNENIRNYYRLQATYNYALKGHELMALAGFQQEDNTYTNVDISKGGFEFPGYEYLSNAIGDAIATGGAVDWAMRSYYARLNYVYNNRYLFEANGRWDASSRFKKDLRWEAFWSVSAGWIITNESFMQPIANVLSYAKLRVSYGGLGNQDTGTNYPSWATVEPGYSYWFDKSLNSGVAITTRSNENIHWEKSTQKNIGLDLGFWNNKLSFTGDFYIKDVKDMLLDFPPPYFQGLKEPYTNAASMRNIGWELMLTYKGAIKKLNYSVSLVLDDVRNEVRDLKGRTYQDKTIVEGYPYKGQWGYVTNGYFQTVQETLDEAYFSTKTPKLGYVKYINQNPDEDNIIDTNDLVYLGDPFPHYNFGIRLNAEWNGFDVMAFIQGVGERKTFMSGIGLVPFTNGSSMFTHQLDSWTQENSNAEYPILLPEANAGDNFQKSDKWVKSGAYTRLKTVEIGYSLPEILIKKIGLANARVFVNGQNLFTISSFYKGYDPEVEYAGSLGGEFYPIMRTFTVGLDIKF